MCATFSGPYEVESKLSDVNYLMKMPDRRRKKRVCHINMLKRYECRLVVPPREAAMVSLVRVRNNEQDCVKVTNDGQDCVKVTDYGPSIVRVKNNGQNNARRIGYFWK